MTLFAFDVARAQELRVRAVVDQVAGSTFYVTMGTEAGIAEGDTLAVAVDRSADPHGRLVVIEASRERSLLTYADGPFMLTRGDVLFLAVPDRPRVPSGQAGRSGDRTIRTALRASGDGGRSDGPRASGRLVFEFTTLRSTTRWGEENQFETDRTFVTPSVALRAVVSQLPGSVTARLNLRATYRHSDGDIVEPAMLPRVYQASVEKKLQIAPVTLVGGRFYSPHESYSGYWDGVLVRVGGRSGGVGIVAGFEPERANGGFSRDFPKYTVFLDYASGGAVRYATDVSAHLVRPRTGAPDHTFLGWSQSLRWRGLRLNQDLQIDEDPLGGQWVVTRLLLNASVPVGPGIHVRGRISRQRPYRQWVEEPEDALLDQRDGAGVGFTYSGTGGSFSADLTANRIEEGETSITYSSSVHLPGLAPYGMGVSCAASYWSHGSDRVFTLSPAVSRAVGKARFRGTYNFHQSQSVWNELESHALDLSLNLPLSEGLSSSLRARTQWSENIVNQRVYASLWMSF